MEGYLRLVSRVVAAAGELDNGVDLLCVAVFLKGVVVVGGTRVAFGHQVTAAQSESFEKLEKLQDKNKRNHT